MPKIFTTIVCYVNTVSIIDIKTFSFYNGKLGKIVLLFPNNEQLYGVSHKTLRRQLIYGVYVTRHSEDNEYYVYKSN